MDWKPGTPLKPDQHENPILEYATVRYPLPEVAPDFFERLFGPGKSRKIKTFGHTEGPLSPHYLALRGGTTLHTDPAFARYSVQLQIVNQGYYTHGLEENVDQYPIFAPGLCVVLDTHSPHKVVPDPRMERTGYCKLSAVIDSWEKPDFEACLFALLERIAEPPEVPVA